MLSKVNFLVLNDRRCISLRLKYIHFSVEEYWEPQLEGLEQIVATRQIPCIHILLSLDKIDENILG